MKNNTSYGICALTKTTGKFVKSHIIPLALTRLSRTGEKYVEAGIGLRMKRRPNSWYDNSLVTRSGEDVLADIDAKAIDILRKNKLVWSGWGDNKVLKVDNLFSDSENAGYRGLTIQNAEALQLFFLSVVWRAAASNRSEFQRVNLTPSELEDIRVRVVLKNPGKFQDYPTQLFQISSIGIPHNRTPLLETKEIPDSAASPEETIDYVRIYFEGLVAHVHLPRGVCLSETYLRTCLRVNEDTIVFLHKFEDSRAQSDIKEMIATVSREQCGPNISQRKLSLAISSALPTTLGQISQDEFGKK